MITTNQLKIYLQFTDSSYDTLLSEIVDFATSYIESYIGQSLKHSTKQDIFQGTGRQFLPLKAINVISVEEVKIDDVVLDNNKYSIKNNMLYKRDLWEKSYTSPNFVDYNVEVSYTYGYDYPQVTDPINISDVPKELQYVALELGKRIFIKCGTQQQVQNEQGSMSSNASMSTSYFEIKFTEDIPKDLKRILDKYRRVGG